MNVTLEAGILSYKGTGIGKSLTCKILAKVDNPYPGQGCPAVVSEPDTTRS
jgi:hypothetical protein